MGADDWPVFHNSDAEHLWTQLTRIADSLGILAAAVTMPTESEPPTAPCAHPIEARISFGQTQGQEDYQCSTCGYRTVPT